MGPNRTENGAPGRGDPAPGASQPGDAGWQPETLVAELGGHPARGLGLDPDDTQPGERALQRWLLACHLCSSLRDEEAGLAALAKLDRHDLAEPEALAAVAAEQVATFLPHGAPRRTDPSAAAALDRLARGLAGREEPLRRCGAEADDLESLAHGLRSLGPGLGPATLRRFLQPLRAAWSAVADLPLEPAAAAAAVHLGWMRKGDEEPSALAAAWPRSSSASAPGPAGLADLEAALARMGRAACVRERPERCLLGARCPLR